MMVLSPEARHLLEWAKSWEAEHPDARGWIGCDVGFEQSRFGELRRAKRIQADGTDGFGHALYHTHPKEEPQ